MHACTYLRVDPMLNCTSDRFPDVGKTACMTPGPGQFAGEIEDGRKRRNKNFVFQTAKELRKIGSAMNPENARKPTFGASSRDDKSPWSYLSQASASGEGLPGPMSYVPRLMGVTKGGRQGTFDDQAYTEAKPSFIEKKPPSFAERFPVKSDLVKEPGSYLGHSHPATGCFGANTRRKTKTYVRKGRDSTFGSSKRFVRKFSSRPAGISGTHTVNRRKGRRALASSGDLLSTINAMKEEAKTWVQQEENVALYGNAAGTARPVLPKSRRDILKSSASQPSFCSPGFGTSKRFHSEMGTEEAFHKWMPGPGHHQSVVTGARRKKSGRLGLKGLDIPRGMEKIGRDSSALSDQQSSVGTKYSLPKSKGTFGGSERESMTKLLKRYGVGTEVDGPGPMDYDYSAHDGFGNQIRSSNARCRQQEEKRVRFMMNRGGQSQPTHDLLAKYSKLTKGRPRTAGLVRSPTKSANPVMDRLGWSQNGRRPKSGQRTRRPQTAGGAMKQRIGAPPSLKQFGID